MFPIINLICITALAYFCVQEIYMKMGIGPTAVQEKNVSQGPIVGKKQTRGSTDNLRQRNRTIISRNLFNVLPEKKKPAGAENKRIKTKTVRAEKSPVQLRLKGTVTGGSAKDCVSC